MRVQDIRVKTSFPGHLKTRRLFKRLGAPGVMSLVFLWAYTGDNKPDGILTNMDDKAIAEACMWEGEPEEFVNVLTDKEIGFAERTEGDWLKLHDWEEHNPWAASARKRSERARVNAAIKWGSRDYSADIEHLEQGADGEQIRSRCPSKEQMESRSGADDLQNALEKSRNDLQGPSLPFFQGADAPSPSPSPSPNIYAQLFDKLWGLYPPHRKLGRKEAFKHFKASVKNQEDVRAIRLALAKFLRSIQGTNVTYIPHGKTWFCNWRDWAEIEDAGSNVYGITDEKRNALKSDLRNESERLSRLRRLLEACEAEDSRREGLEGDIQLIKTRISKIEIQLNGEKANESRFQTAGV